jgi:hypothetical protein
MHTLVDLIRVTDTDATVRLETLETLETLDVFWSQCLQK